MENWKYSQTPRYSIFLVATTCDILSQTAM